MNTKWLAISLAATLASAPLRAQGDSSVAATDTARAAMAMPDDSAGTGQAHNGSVLTRYDRRVHRYRRHWQSLIPTQSVVQFAGNMGLLSFGVGWDYGRHKQWETHLLFGFLPRYGSNRAKATMTVKENFIPWSVALGDHWAVEPLSVGLYINTVFGSEFWSSQPARYPEGYYFMSTKLRLNVFVGQRVELTLPRNRRKFVKGITAFYELSTCDLYLISAVTNRYLRPRDYLSLSFGVKVQLL